MISELNICNGIFYLPRFLDFIRSKSFGTYDLSGLKIVMVIGSLLTTKIGDQLKEAFQRVHGTCPSIVSGYASTECGGVVFRKIYKNYFRKNLKK